MSSLPTIVIGAGIEIAPAAGDPLVVRRAEITRDLLREGIRGLAPLERDALRLATRERLNIADAAAALGADSHTIEANLRSGLLKLRQSLLEQLGESAS